jgi:ABC-2 type transport system ATP-binding protein
MGAAVPLAIKCRQLVKTYPGRPPVDAVREIDLEVAEGECFGMLGPNGAGKTTTVEIFEGLLQPTDGTVEILGRSWTDHPAEIRERIAVCLQETRLSEKLTVLETLTLFRSFYREGLPPQDAIAAVGLTEKTTSRIQHLSGGQKQRVALATALVGQPDLLFLDEPTTGLDPQSRRDVWDIISQFQSSGRTILLTTHYMEEAERLCDRVAILDHGKILALDTPRSLIASLATQQIVEFTVESAGPVVEESVWLKLPSVLESRREGEMFRLSVGQIHVAVPAVIDYCRTHNLPLASLTTRQATLEDVFVHLTGRHLDEETSQQQVA